MGSVTISSATDDPGIVNASLTDVGGGLYTYDWNTAGQTSADDYQVEVRLTDGVYTDTDGLSVTPDLNLVLAPTLSFTETYSIDLSSGSRIQGITWAGGDFWVTEGGLYPEKLHKVDLNTGNHLATCDAAINSGGFASSADDITWDGTNLWVVNNYAGDDITGHTTGCSILSPRLPSPGPSPLAIASNGSSFWVSDSDFDTIYQLNGSGTIINSFPSPGKSPEGLVWDGSNLWGSDILSSALNRLNLSTGDIEEYRPLISGGVFSLAWDGSNFYGHLGNTEVVKLDIKPDLALAELEIDTSLIQEGESSLITATVYAHDLPSNNLILRFYEGNPDESGVQIGPDHNLGSINPGSPSVVMI